jgi:hypothetical protein
MPSAKRWPPPPTGGVVRTLTGAALGGILVAARVRGSEAGGKPKSAKLYLVSPDALTNCDDQKISGRPRGSVSFSMQPGEILATISLQNARPNSQYEVFQRCVGGGGWYIGTNDKGAGNGSVAYPPASSNGIDLRLLDEEHIDMGPFPLSL